MKQLILTIKILVELLQDQYQRIVLASWKGQKKLTFRHINLPFFDISQDYVHLVDCNVVPEDILESVSIECFATNFDIFVRSSEETFKFNTKTREKFFKKDPIYPECLALEDWNTNEIQSEILRWRKSIMNKEDLHWFHDSSPEPLDPLRPRLQITFDQLIGRKGFEKLKVKMFLRQFYCLFYMG